MPKPASRTMRCPACAGPVTAVRSGNVEYDRCQDCGGVWLDRGELEQLIALAYRTGAATTSRSPRAAGP